MHRALSIIFLAVAPLIGVMFVNISPASADIPRFVQGYQLRFWHDYSRCLDIARSFVGDANSIGQVIKYPCGTDSRNRAQPNQVFRLRYVPDALGAAYELRPQHADHKCVSINGQSTQNWAFIVTWECFNHPAQKWRLINVDDPKTGGAVLIKSVHSNRCISVPYGNDDRLWEDGVQMIQWDCDRTTRAQQIRLTYYSD